MPSTVLPRPGLNLSKAPVLPRPTINSGRFADAFARAASARSAFPLPGRLPLAPASRPSFVPSNAARTGLGVVRAAAPRVSTAPAAQPASTPLSVDRFPRPDGDNGRGMHWVPTTSSSPDVVDRYVAEAKSMGVKWMVFLNDGASVGPNDYLVQQLVRAGIEPVMRIYTPTVGPIKGNVEAMVRHYVGLGVHYFQPYNEPNLRRENPDGRVSVDRYVERWASAAKAILRGGGLPGFGSLAPGGDLDDQQFLRQAIQGLRKRGQTDLLDRAWLSMHNYALNYPATSEQQASADGNGFWKFRAYHRLLRQELGRDMPIVGTEGGAYVGSHEDKSWPAVDQGAAVAMVRGAYRYMRDTREPWNFVYSYWVIANEAGGGTDPGFSEQALFKADGTASPIVGALKGMA